MNQLEVDLLYMTEVGKLAMCSPDPSTQNAAIIVRDNTYFSVGQNNLVGRAYNTFPDGIAVTPERLQDRTFKYPAIVHGEAGSIADAAFNGRSTLGAVMYAWWFACEDCSKMMLSSGISEVVGHVAPELFWMEQAKTEEDKKAWDKGIGFALDRFKEAGLSYRYIDGPLPGVQLRFRGKAYDLSTL